MKIKFLSAIASFFFISFAMSSCLGEEEVTEYSPNALIVAFELDKVLGINYTFTIDQRRGEIYNIDSLPVGSDTIIDRILITKLSTASGIISVRNAANTEDSLLNIADSVNLAGTMTKPFKFKVFAPNMAQTKEYSLVVRVHQVQPDSLDWGRNPITTGYAPSIGRQKAINIGENIYVFAENDHQRAYMCSTANGSSWTQINVNLPSDFKSSSIVNFNNVLYVATESGEVYSSQNAREWSKHATLSQKKVKTLITSFPDPSTENNLNRITGIAGIIDTNNGLQFYMTDTKAQNWAIDGDKVPSNFPLDNISAMTRPNGTGVQNAILVGNMVNIEPNDTATVAWGSFNGTTWASLESESKYTCPKLEDPAILYYGDEFYVFGKDFKTFYKSKNAIVWHEAKSEFMFPMSIRGKKSDYSVVVDNKHFIWIMRSTPNEVWRGRLNKLGFAVQF